MNDKEINDNTKNASKEQKNPSPVGRGKKPVELASGKALITFPNALTCGNLISGCISTGFAFFHSPDIALMWIIIGAVFDFFDGMSARALHISSPIGRELDSLADDVTFGVAPSTIIFSQLMVMDYPQALGETIILYIPFVAYVMAAFSALRLAKFNLDERQRMGFIGLPTPANALFWGSFILSLQDWLNSLSFGSLLIIVMMLVSSWLLISEIPMFALKFKHWGWQGNGLRYGFMALSAIIVVASTINGAMSGKGLLMGFLGAWWMVILVYVLLSLLADARKVER